MPGNVSLSFNTGSEETTEINTFPKLASGGMAGVALAIKQNLISGSDPGNMLSSFKDNGDGYVILKRLKDGGSAMHLLSAGLPWYGRRMKQATIRVL
jgi:hypothetical protein